jgi:hypothetical protein
VAFEQEKDRRVQKLTFVAALFDPQNNFVTGKQAEMELALKPDTFDRGDAAGGSCRQLPAPRCCAGGAAWSGKCDEQGATTDSGGAGRASFVSGSSDCVRILFLAKGF